MKIKPNKLEKLQLVVVSIILFVILSTAIKLTFEGYYGFYYEDGNYKENIFSKITNKLSDFYPIRYFNTQTGFDTGYGFFAPNVASDFLFIFKIYDKNNNLVKIENGVQLKTKESNLRFQTINTMYLDKLKKKEDKNYNEKYNKYLDVIMKQVTKFIKNKYPNNYDVKTSLYLYDFPSIKKFNKGEKERLFLIKTYEL